MLLEVLLLITIWISLGSFKFLNLLKKVLAIIFDGTRHGLDWFSIYLFKILNFCWCDILAQNKYTHILYQKRDSEMCGLHYVILFFSS